MPTLPWATGPSTPPPGGTVVMASRLELRRRRDVLSFLRASLRLRRAFRSAPGAIALGLAAQPLARTFWTVSAWADHDQLNAYSRSPLHREITVRFRPAMASSRFVDWRHEGDELPSWDEARRRLAHEPEGRVTPRPG
jgi:hypothetical protein